MNALRRFAAALRTARWGQVVVELTLLIAGILIALAIDGWMDDRRDARVEREYLQLLARDLEQDLETLDDVRRFEETQVAASVAVYRGLRLGVPVEDREAISLALSELTSRRTLRLRRATYTDLLSTGNLRLIRNTGLRDRIVRLYENGERAQSIRDRNNQEFVDRMYMTYLLDHGFVAPRPARNLVTNVGADQVFANRIGFVPDPGQDPIWRLPPSSPELNVLAGRVWYRGLVSQAALNQTLQTVEEITEVRKEIAGELASRRWP